MPFKIAELGHTAAGVVFLQQLGSLGYIALAKRLKGLLHPPGVGILLVGISLALRVLAMPVGIRPGRYGLHSPFFRNGQGPCQAPRIQA